MVLKITMEDLFYGFVRNYYSFGIKPGTRNTKWTNEILGYFAKLGKMLGFFTEYEWQRYDLVWFWGPSDEDDEKPMLHIEHENSQNRQSNLLEKAANSRSENLILIWYPKSERNWDEFVERLLEISENKEILAIKDSVFIKGRNNIIEGVIIKDGRVRDELKAKRFTSNSDEFYILEPIYE